MKKLLPALFVLACTTTTPRATPPAQAPESRPPSRHAAGEVVDANVPLPDGGVVALADLRGKLVVLELVDTAHRDAAVESDYARVLAEAEGAVEIVMVSLDAEGWAGDTPPFRLGWDPQGALAARLLAASVPTVILIDREGRVAAQYSGARAPGHGELLAKLRSSL
jgi:hypothetical protein